MSKISNIPDSWGIADDQATKVREAQSKKSTKPEDAVQKAVEELARDIAIIEPDSRDWTGWVNYLLESLQTEAQKDRKSATYEAMLLDLREALEPRIEGGKL
jgi:hypothetical protein